MLIFFNNCIKNGVLPLVLSKNLIDKLIEHSFNKKKIKVSLVNKEVYYDNLAFDFKISENIRERLLNGYDDIELTLKKVEK